MPTPPIGKRDIAKVAAILREEHDTAEDMARSVLQVVFAEIVPAKYKYVVVGQVHPREGGWITDQEGKDSKVAFLVGTAGQARSLGSSLALSHATGDTATWWALELRHDTPAAFWKDLKAKHEREGFLTSAHPRELRLAMQTAWHAKHPGADLPEELRGNGWNELEGFTRALEDGELDEHLAELTD